MMEWVGPILDELQPCRQDVEGHQLMSRICRTGIAVYFELWQMSNYYSPKTSTLEIACIINTMVTVQCLWKLHRALLLFVILDSDPTNI